jgi:RNA polymerase sigma factor (sigma-70 family)
VRQGAPLGELETLYETSYGDFLRVATAIVGNEEAARDVVQDAFVGCVRHRDTYRGDGALEAWVWRAVVNSARKWWRGARVEVPREVGDISGEVQSDGVASGDFADLRAAIRVLPERQRLVLFLRYYSDLDYQAIADVLGIRSGTVGAALNSAHAAVRRRLPEESHA